VSAYTVNTTSGGLTVIPGSPFPGGSVPYSGDIDPSGRFLYVANLFGRNISAYTINPANGTLTVVGGSPFLTGWSVRAVITVGVFE
jgi:6-phosphogluconolactonase